MNTAQRFCSEKFVIIKINYDNFERTGLDAVPVTVDLIDFRNYCTDDSVDNGLSVIRHRS